MIYLRIYIIGILFVSAAVSQRIYIEPDIGVYKPSAWSKLDSITVNSKVKTLNFNYDYFLRYGVKIGLAFSSDNRIYMGYKMWSNTEATNYNTFVFGITGENYLDNSDIGLRMGIEAISGKMYNESDSPYPNDPIWKLQYKSSGVSFETGVVYRINERIKIFSGINYLTANVVLDRIIVEDDFYTLTDINKKKSDVIVNMNGFNFKFDISFILSKPIKFEN